MISIVFPFYVGREAQEDDCSSQVTCMDEVQCLTPRVHFPLCWAALQVAGKEK
jgi:hypothetical protein